MSRHFSANQFDPEFAPQRLCNWEVPKHHRSTPAHRKGGTKIVSNERGHLLPGIPRSTHIGEHRCASAQPKLFAKDQCSDLNATKQPDLSYKPGDLTDPDRRHHSHIIFDEKSSVRLPELNGLYVEKPQNLDSEQNLCCEHDQQKSPNVVELIDQLPQIERITMRQEVSEKPGECNTIPLIPAYCNFQAARKMAQENLEHQPLPDSIMDRTFLKMQAQGLLNPELSLNVEPIATGVGVRTHNAGPTHCTKLKVYRPKTCGVVPPPINSRMGSGGGSGCGGGSESRPQTAFNHKSKIEPMELAICWDYTPPNPLHEPKASAHIDGSEDTVAPAIFSVVKTPRPTEDHNNTGRSAGVFAHTAGEESFFDKDIMLRNKNYFSTRLEQNTDRTCKCSANARSHSAGRKGSSQEQHREYIQQQHHLQHQKQQQQQQQRLQAKSRCKSSPNLSVLVQPSEASVRESIIVCNYNKEHYHYRPEPTKRHRNPAKKHTCCERNTQRPLRLCEQNLQKLNQTSACTKHPVEFKAAFKAGAVKSQSSGICTSLEHTSNGSTSTATEFTTKVFKIPKPKQPYAKKNYTIDTLAPPFACWRGGAGQGGYPEHWRLASVYQHAYKPMEQRKRPLLATVFQ